MSSQKPIVNGAKLRSVLDKVLGRLNVTDAKVYLVTKTETLSPRDRALGQKPKLTTQLHELIPSPGVFPVGYKEVMADQGIVISGDYKVVVSGLFGIEHDADGNIIPYDWKEGDIVSYKDMFWRVYLIKRPVVDGVVLAYTLFMRKQPAEGYVPSDL